MEIQEKEVHSLQKTAPQRKRLLEMKEKEEIPLHEFKVRSEYGKFILEKELHLEKKNEGSLFSKVISLRRV